MSWEKHFALGKAKVLLWEKQIRYFGKGFLTLVKAPSDLVHMLNKRLLLL